MTIEELDTAERAILAEMAERAKNKEPVEPHALIGSLAQRPELDERVVRAAMWELVDWGRLKWLGNNTLTLTETSQEPLPQFQR